MSYPVDSADARELAELADAANDEPNDDIAQYSQSARYRQIAIPMPPEIATEIRRTLADKGARSTNEDE